MKRKKIKVLLILALVSLLSFTMIASSVPESWSNPKSAEDVGITEFNESPMLKELVEQGELESVEERLPQSEAIQVIEPVEGVGEYGGTLTSAAVGPTSWADGHYMMPQMFGIAQDQSVYPQIAKDYELLNNNKELIIYLREGLKWSDGHPFTTDDIMFWWNDMAMNEDINHWTVGNWSLDGIRPEIEQIDEYTIKFTFPEPNPTIVKSALSWWQSMQGYFFMPAHYMKQFHLEYNSDVKETADEEGFDSWVNYFEHMGTYGAGQQNPDLPVLAPWVMESRDTNKIVYVRNPYYYGVDTEGNQLPYIDRWEIKIMSEVEVAKVDALQGNLDIAGRILTTEEFPLYKQNEEKGDYKVHPWQSSVNSQIAFGFNVNNPDEEKSEIYGDVRFRRAISLAVNRDEINEFAFRGLAEPMQVTASPGESYYQEEWAESYAEFDPEKANELLDEMGLEKGRDGFRRMPSGETLVIDFQFPTPGSVGGTAQLGKVAELLKDYWEEVGVKTKLKVISRELYEQRIDGASHDVGIWPVNVVRRPSALDPRDESLGVAIKWNEWVEWQDWDKRGRDGEEPAKGIEPPEEVKELFNMLDDRLVAETEEEFYELNKKIYDFYADQLYIIGTVARPLAPVIVSNDLHNLPEQAVFDDPTGWWNITLPQQWYKSN